MSSRSLRRLQEQNEISKLEQIANISDSEDETIKKVNKKKNKKKNLPKPGNVFDLLNEEEPEAEEKEESGGANEENKSETTISPRNRKKKKKKKKKTKQTPTETENGELDEIDRSIIEVNQLLGVASVAVTTRPRDTTDDKSNILKNKSILHVDTRNLNPDNEMKRKFGNSVIQGERRRNPHERRFKRATSLVTPRNNWPQYHKVGINMIQVKEQGSTKSSHLFAFEHQEIYQKVQFMFYDAVESLDHNNIMELLNTHPYHVDSLLQLSEVCRINEDFQMAAELIERALFVFECSFHTLFNITLGECRLEYKRAENRPFFLALFRHVRYVGERACYRTALEFCKVLFGLDPSEDPLCVLLMMDYYAIKADQCAYFIQLYDELEILRRVSLLPNFAYSYALAKFYNGDENEADNALQKALISFPSLLVELMDQCGISLDDVIKNNKLFDRVSYLSQSLSLNQLTSLYVGRSYSLWKPPEVLNWLTKNCMYIIKNELEFKTELEEAEIIREKRYKKSPKNVLRHIIISDVKEALRHLPPEVRHQTVMTHDPLPPADSVRGYERPRTNNHQSNESMLSMFLQSLMPSYNPNNLPRNNQDRNNQIELQNEARAMDNQEIVQNAIQDGAARLMDAMRELLNTMTYRNDGVAGNEEERNAEDEEQWDDER